MTRNGRFFSENKQAAAILKHGILERYLASFVGKLGSTSLDNRVGYLDGYAGSGVYVNEITRRISSGSPKIALDLASGLKGRQLECAFVELQATQFRSLRDLVATSGDPHATAHFGDVAQHAEAVLKRFEGIPLLVFLDPFGTALETGIVVDRILNRKGSAPTELLLNFSIDSVRRIGSLYYKPEGTKGREASLRRLTNWLGGDWWQEHFSEASKGEVSVRATHAAEAVFREYVTRINSASGSGSFAVPIRRQAHHKPIFNLTLFFQRTYAIAPFNEAVSKATETWRRHLQDLDMSEADYLDGLALPLPGMSRVEELTQVFEGVEVAFKRDTIELIKASIRAQLGSRAELKMRSDFQRIYGEAIGSGRELHLRAAWKELAILHEVNPCPTGSLDSATIRRL
jgi:three-Cys-motif partner protein